MIELVHGDILQADAEALVNTVNCVGVMGRGLALQFKKVFPNNFKHYKAACDKKELRPGEMFVYNLNSWHNPRHIINFPTKRHWKDPSRMEDIETGLQTLIEEVRKRNIRSIAIPPLGYGLGGLSWPDVRSKIEEAFQDLMDVQILLYESI
jgi:O-acetyl-ADP-ribose deacetylase (regulator of RNase III)